MNLLPNIKHYKAHTSRATYFTRPHLNGSKFSTKGQWSVLLGATAIISTGVIATQMETEKEDSISDKIEDFYEDNIKAPIVNIKRFLRATYDVAVISSDYKWNMRGIERDDPRYREIAKQINARTAQRILRLCKTHGGLYTKAGQHVASLTHVIPQEFTGTLSVLQDKANHMSFKQVKKAFKREKRMDIEDVFQEFNEKPIAAASLAQVHEAYLRDGSKVAVKVQYLGLENRAKGDLSTFSTLLKVVAYFFPHFEFTWVLPEFKNAMEMELDFIHEGKNAERSAYNFRNNNNLKIPKIYWPLTTKRILTMEFCEGVKINDLEAIERMGLNRNQIAKLFVDILSEQIFVHGFIHGDPHPGNIFVRPKNSTKDPELVLLDHGLYKEIPENVRLGYCQLWKGIVLRDKNEINQAAQKLGVGSFSNLLTGILTFGSDKSSDERVRLSDKEKSELKLQLRGNRGMVNEMLQSLPLDLILVLRTQHLIRYICNELQSDINRYGTFAKYGVIGLHTNDEKSLTTWKSLKELFLFNFYLQIYNIIYSMRKSKLFTFILRFVNFSIQ